MSGDNRSFPRWAAPFVGSVVGAFFSLKAAGREVRGDTPWQWILAGGTILGFVAGGIIWILDSPATAGNIDAEELSAADLDSEESVSPELVPSSLVGRFLALLCVLLCILPWVGLMVSVPAVVVNYRTRDWTRSVSRICMAIALIVTIPLTVMLIIMPPR